MTSLLRGLAVVWFVVWLFAALPLEASWPITVALIGAAALTVTAGAIETKERSPK